MENTNFYFFKEILQLERPLGANDFIIGNLDMAGYYRVNYDVNNWRQITRQIINFKDVEKINIFLVW